MNRETGVVVPEEKKGEIPVEVRKEIKNENLSQKHRRELAEKGWTKIGPNAKCPCGSGIKFKKCCKMVKIPKDKLAENK